jgi:hypothetical protein
MIRWRSVVLAPARLLVLFAVLYAIFEGGLSLLEWYLGVGRVDSRPGKVMLVATCLAYASYRAMYFHPFYDFRYGQWLRTTPWTSSKPLPLGPVHLVWQDSIPLLAIALLAFLQGDLNPLHLLIFSLLVYLAVLALGFRATGQWAFAYAVAFGLGFVVRLWYHPWFSAAAAVLLYPVAYAGLRQSLAKFPWDVPWMDHFGRAMSGRGTTNPAGDENLLGWPFERLRPKLPARTGISTREALLVSLLAGWWLYAVAPLLSDPRARLGMVLFAHFSAIMFLTLGRMIVYCVGYEAPISVWGRLWTFRWIIPGYDKVFVAPLAAVLIGSLLPGVAAAHGLEPEFAMPPALSLALLAGLSLGPSLLNWRLTGQHRLVPGASMQQRCIKVG